MHEGVNLLSLKLFGESKCPGYLNFIWNYFRTHYSDVRWCTRKWTLSHRRKKTGGITRRIPFSYLILFILSLTRNCIFWTIFIVFSLSIELNEEYINTNYHTYVITLYFYTRTVFSNKLEIHVFECCYFLNCSI